MSAAVFLVLSSLAIGDVDFVRGDANSDGVVSIADAHFHLAYLFRGLTPPECLAAADANDDDKLNIVDAIWSLNLLFLNGPENPPPYPAAGPDPTPGELDCASYGNGAPLADPGAALAVLDAIASGGADTLATITIAASSSTAIAGYSGAIRLPPELAAGASEGVVDLTGTFEGGFRSARVQGGSLIFGYLASFTGPNAVPPGMATPVLEISLCLVQGLAAGDYPLLLEAGELVDSASGRAIRPVLENGLLTLESPVTSSPGCGAPPPPPPEQLPIEAAFELSDVTAPPGAEVTVPFFIRSNTEIQGYAFSVDFDETLLEGTRIEQVWKKPVGSNPLYGFVKLEINNRDDHPGSGGIDEGFFVGAAVFDFERPVAMPKDTDNEALRFHLKVKAEAPDGSTEVAFLDGGKGTGQPVRNVITASGETVTPEIAMSFVLVDCLLQILPDGAVFLRGDANRDGRLDISDPLHTLGYLFLGDTPLTCADAADANDDGHLDLSDPVAALGLLFLGTVPALPPPGPDPGADPTADDLFCFFIP